MSKKGFGEPFYGHTDRIKQPPESEPEFVDGDDPELFGRPGRTLHVRHYVQFKPQITQMFCGFLLIHFSVLSVSSNE